MAIEIRVPDIGDYHDVPVIEILVKAGDHVSAEDPLLTLESDKATMDVPAPSAGIVQSVAVAVGDKVSQGSVILLLEPAAVATAPAAAAPAVPAAAAPAAAPAAAVVAPAAPVSAPAAAAAVITVTVPDIGDYRDIPVIEVLVKEGDSVAREDALVTLESDKATMDVPSPAGGVVRKVLVKVGDKVSQGTAIVELAAAGAAPAAEVAASAPAAAAATAVPAAAPAAAPAAPAAAPVAATAGAAGADVDISAAHASPSVRRFARELGVNLNQVKGTGPKERITEDDVKAFVKQSMQRGAATPAAASGGNLGGMELLPWPQVDFTRFGEVEVRPLSRIKKISGANLHRNWVRIPHVTNNDEADITDLEALRNELNGEMAKAGVKLTALAFLIKAVTVALRQYPDFNASLDGDNLVLKRYFHIGFAADTPNGLVVPVLKNADRKGVLEIARESSELAAKAREGKLGPADMSGGCFSISSLGGIGGGHFTPIINAPEVAILGVGRSTLKPVWDGKAFVPRLMLPLSLSYDHRVIDGASAARFNALLGKLLGDMRRALL
ncbi:MAG: dihydrolipoyllysine-residue acetyltransferase [Pseudomonadota bacterium]|nr:dihydrolipoyllysine-residue acetyltransferase [Pseudomonadota bacterium]